MGVEQYELDLSALLPERVSVFMYELCGIGSAVGLSPHPKHWSLFLALYGNKMGTCPPGMVSTQRTYYGEQINKLN